MKTKLALAFAALAISALSFYAGWHYGWIYGQASMAWEDFKKGTPCPVQKPFMDRE